MPSGRSGVVAGVDAERPDRPLVRYHDESGRIREAVMQVVDGEVRDPALPADDRPGGGRAPDGADGHGPATGGSLRELDRTARR